MVVAPADEDESPVGALARGAPLRATAPAEEHDGGDRRTPQRSPACHGQVAGLAVPLVALAETVSHHDPLSPIRWNTLSYWVDPRLHE